MTRFTPNMPQRRTCGGAGKPARRRGATLLEIVIASTITAILLAFVGRWVVSLVALSAGLSDVPQAQLVASRVVADLTRDAQQAKPCNLYGLAQPVLGIEPDEVVFSVDTNGDGLQDAVLWQVEDGVLTRTVTLATAPCEFNGDSSTITVATGIRPVTGGDFQFAPIVAGETRDNLWGSCTGLLADNCNFDAINVNLVTVIDGKPAPINFNAGLNTNWTAL